MKILKTRVQVQGEKIGKCKGGGGGGGRAPVVFGRHGIGSLCVRRGGEVEELVCEGEVAALLGRRVRLHQHPLAQDVLGVLRPHPRRRLRTVAANRRPPLPGTYTGKIWARL